MYNLDMVIVKVGDNLPLQFDELDEKIGLTKFFNKKIFRVADTPLTYRQVNSLEESGLLNPHRKDTSNWRRFSFKELVYFGIVSSVRKFGLKNEQLKDLWLAFFGEKDKIDNFKPNKYISDLVLGCSFMQVEIMTVVGSEGEVYFLSPVNYAHFSERVGPCICLRLNDIVNGILKSIGKRPIPITRVWNYTLSNKEKELIERIRVNDFESFSVKMKNKEPDTVYFDSIGKEGLSIEEIAKLIKDNDYQNLELTRRGGVNVNLKRQTVVKLGSTERNKNAG